MIYHVTTHGQLVNRKAMYDYFDPETGEVLVQQGDILSALQVLWLHNIGMFDVELKAQEAICGNNCA